MFSYTLRWRHNGHDVRLKSPASPLFTQPFIRVQISSKRLFIHSMNLIQYAYITQGYQNVGYILWLLDWSAEKSSSLFPKLFCQNED